MQNLQIVLDSLVRIATLAEPIVGHAKAGRREQILAVGVLGERSRLANQRVDHVPVVHRMTIATHQPRQCFHTVIGVPHLDPVGEEPRFHPLADQSAVHRVDVAVQVNQAAAVHATQDLPTRREPRVGQRTQRRQLLREPIPPTGVAGRHQLRQELRVLLAARKLAGASQQQGLIHSGFEVPVRRLRIAILVRLSHVDPLARQLVVRQQVAVASLKFTFGGVIVHRRGEAVTAMLLRHATQFPQRILQPVTQRFERFRGTYRDRFPVRVSEHEVVDQVIESLPGDGDGERVHRGEVGRGQLARFMNLPEDDGLVRPVQGSPPLHASLEGSPMRVEEASGMLLSEPVEEGLGVESRLGLESRFDGGPNLGKGIGPRAVVSWWPRLFAGTGECAIVAVVSSGFVGHARAPCGVCEGSSAIEFAEESSNLAIRNHRTSPILREWRLWPKG